MSKAVKVKSSNFDFRSNVILVAWFIKNNLTYLRNYKNPKSRRPIFSYPMKMKILIAI